MGTPRTFAVNESGNRCIHLTEAEKQRAAELEKSGDQNGLDQMAASLYAEHELWETAYHEAGHAAAGAFFGWAPGGVDRVSIVPDGNSSGRVTCCRSGSQPFESAYRQAVAEMIFLRSGECAQHRLGGTKEDNVIFYGSFEDLKKTVKDGIQDIGMLGQACLGIRDPKTSAGARAFASAFTWSSELLRIPRVWRCVEACAELLMERREISGDEVREVFRDITGMWKTIPRWRRRFTGLTRAERKEDETVEELLKIIEGIRGPYITTGSLRGGCGHRHRSIAAAVRCLDRDRRTCLARGERSDRRVVHANGSELVDIELGHLSALDSCGGRT